MDVANQLSHSMQAVQVSRRWAATIRTAMPPPPPPPPPAPLQARLCLCIPLPMRQQGQRTHPSDVLPAPPSSPAPIPKPQAHPCAGRPACGSSPQSRPASRGCQPAGASQAVARDVRGHSRLMACSTPSDRHPLLRGSSPTCVRRRRSVAQPQGVGEHLGLAQDTSGLGSRPVS